MLVCSGHPSTYTYTKLFSQWSQEEPPPRSSNGLQVRSSTPVTVKTGDRRSPQIESKALRGRSWPPETFIAPTVRNKSLMDVGAGAGGLIQILSAEARKGPIVAIEPRSRNFSSPRICVTHPKSVRSKKCCACCARGKARQPCSTLSNTCY